MYLGRNNCLIDDEWKAIITEKLILSFENQKPEVWSLLYDGDVGDKWCEVFQLLNYTSEK